MVSPTSDLTANEGTVMVGVMLRTCMASVWVALYEVRGSGGGGGNVCGGERII